jgi:DNA polymerase III subunit epsilon
MLASSPGTSRRRALPEGGLERETAVRRRCGSLRRAGGWRWNPPAADVVVDSPHAQRRWDEARAKAITWAAAVSADPRVVYLDTETTGFGPGAEIVDVAVVGASGEILFNSLVRPLQRIPAEVIAIHGITDGDVANAPCWDELYVDLRQRLEGRRIVVYNVAFDRQMIAQSCAQCGLPLPAADWDCAMKKYAGFHGSWDPAKRWYKFQKLERAVLAFGAEPGGHRAAADAMACRAVVLGMAATPLPAIGSAFPDRSLADARGISATTIAAERPDVPAEAMVRWSRAARGFLLLLETIPAGLSDLPGACGVWSVREVAAHCAGWEWEAVRRLRLAAANPELPDAIYDVDGFNAASVAVRARMSWSATVEDLRKATAALAHVAAAGGHETQTRDWLHGRAADFEGHTEELRRWLATAGASFGTPADGVLAQSAAPRRLENGDSLA